MPYNIDETISVGDAGHVLHHEDLAVAVNDLDSRATTVEGVVASKFTLPADPNADRILFWDESAGFATWLTLGTNLSITGTTLNAAGGGGGGTWGSITGTLSEQTDLAAALAGKQAAGSYASATHSHAISDVTALQSALDGKSATGHTHTISNITNLQTTLDGKASSTHSHAISDVTGLQSALDGKQASGSYASSTHTHAISDVSGLQTALDGKQASGNYVIAASTGAKLWIGTQSQYDAIVTKDATTLYNITD